MKKVLLIIAAIAVAAAIGFFGRLLGINGALIGILAVIVGAVLITMISGDKEDEEPR